LGNAAIRRGRWKLVWDKFNRARQWELYDMQADRTELNDLAAEKPELVAQMRAGYERWARATGRPVPGEGE
jgi:arylsulfatase